MTGTGGNDSEDRKKGFIGGARPSEAKLTAFQQSRAKTTEQLLANLSNQGAYGSIEVDPRSSMIGWMDNLFDHLANCEYEWNQMTERADMKAMLERPEPASKTSGNAKLVLKGRLSMHGWSMFVRATSDSIESYVMPSDRAISFTVNPGQFSRIIQIDAEERDGLVYWFLGQRPIEWHEVPDLAKQLMEALIAVASGEANLEGEFKFFEARQTAPASATAAPPQEAAPIRQHSAILSGLAPESAARPSHPQVVLPGAPTGPPSHSAILPESQPARPLHPSIQPESQPARPLHPSIQPESQPARPLHPSIQPESQPARPLHPSIQPESQPARPLHPSIQPESQPAAQMRPAHPSIQPESQPAPPIHPSIQPESQPAPQARPAHPSIQPETEQRTTLRLPAVQPTGQPIRPLAGQEAGALAAQARYMSEQQIAPSQPVPQAQQAFQQQGGPGFGGPPAQSGQQPAFDQARAPGPGPYTGLDKGFDMVIAALDGEIKTLADEGARAFGQQDTEMAERALRRTSKLKMLRADMVATFLRWRATYNE
jgi:hypothetical protein